MRGPLKWFGAVFGIVVLIGAGLVYVAGGSDDGTDEVAAVAEAPAEEPMADEAAHDEAEEVAVGTPAAGHDDEAAHDEAEEAAVGTPAAAQDDEQAGLAIEVVEIEMADYSYTPDTIDIQAGVPVIFRFTNTGNYKHEAMIGDAHMQEEFEAAGDHDDAHGDEDGHHGDVMAVMVQPGETADLEVVVDEPGTTYMACHVKGHYEKGQVATINVTA